MDATSPVTQRWLDTDAAGAHLNISPRTLERWRVDGRGPPYSKFGRLCRYSVEELDRWGMAQIIQEENP